MVFVKKLRLSSSFVLIKIEQEKPIVDVSERKEAVFDDEKKKTILKKPKICIFPKRLVHGFCQKIKTFSMFCLNAK